MLKRVSEDIASIKRRDPAAASTLGILLFYPGFHAIQVYRLARWLWQRGWRGPAVFLSYCARAVTGIEIHPGAAIGRRFFIDHGTGVVIGSTAEIGDDVTLYQGATLGGTSLHGGKRHPTLRDGVIVGANATVLGPVVVGQSARVGANAVVLKDVPEGCTVVGVPAVVVKRRDEKGEPQFLPYGTPCEEVVAPLDRTIRGLMEEMQSMRQRLEALEQERAEARQQLQALVFERERERAARDGDGPQTAC